ncbi:dCTP deaminase [Ferroplasma sp.]|uniref:dCTP deaminase domain-containing protein n=1 Tax=Ferroplasma sp. TaxID=2591003 RepID=UPI00261EE2C2|nr:dCTP deaminase [Ferroplasma sp.]MCL4453529.1 dCTP deaminase [Candidatus Thermoplasmatota archaeon]
MLNDMEISSLIMQGKLISENYEPDCLTPNGYDLRVGEHSEETVEKNKLFFISSMELLDMPDNIVASLYIKSRYARHGIFSSFGFVDAGFSGNLTMAFYNFGEPLEIRTGIKFVQIVFHEIKSPEKNYASRSGHFQGSRGIDRG